MSIFLLYTELTVIAMNGISIENITVAEGSNVTLSCGTTLNVTMNYEWKRKSKSLPEVNVMESNKNLTIYNIKTQNSGLYYCQVNITGITIRSMNVQVTARSKLLIQKTVPFCMIVYR